MDKIKEIKNKYSCKYSSEHYDFCFSSDSLAEKDIVEIANYQEYCYNKITSALNIVPDFRIQYLLADAPEDLGVLYGDNEPCNGYAHLPCNIYAVYNEKVKCVGMHEDVHIISYSVKKPISAFMREGLAMYFDEQWQGKPNVEWCRDLIKGDRLPKAIDLIDNNIFFDINETLSYPLAGAFTKFLIEKLSMSEYLKQLYFNDDIIGALTKIFGETEKVQFDFIDWLNINKF